MKAFTGLVLICLVVSVLAVASFTSASTSLTPRLGVKEGDWIKYNVNITGNPSPVHRNVTWMHLQILAVDGAAFPANVTLGFANGTTKSSIWQFNLTAGNTEGWIIIPTNLGAGGTFFDNYSKTGKNIAIQSETEKTVLGANRAVTYAITYGNESHRDKLWDKETGVFVESVEVFKNWTAVVTAVDTNLWSHEQLQEQGTVYSYLTAIAAGLAVALASGALLLVARAKKRMLKSTKRRILIGALLTGFVVAVAATAVTPLNESPVPLSFRDINLGMQTLWLTMLLVSMWFRSRGNFKIHGILMLIVVTVTLVSFSGVLIMDPPSASGMGAYFKSAGDVWVFVAHGVFSIPAIAFGVWLVALWRPNSQMFPQKSRSAAQLVTVFWVLSYVVGILDYTVMRAMLV